MPPRIAIAQVKKAWELRNAGRSVKDIADEVHVDQRQVNNYLSLRWLEQRGLTYLRDARVGEPLGVETPALKQARERCQATDHIWMEDDLFLGHAFTKQVHRLQALVRDRGAMLRVLRGEEDPKLVSPVGNDGDYGSQERRAGTVWPIDGEVRRCHLCGFEKWSWHWAGPGV